MHPSPRTIRERRLAAEAAQLMEQHRITSVLVVDAEGVLVGARQQQRPDARQGDLMAHPRSACGASPSRGRHQRPGKAGSAAALGYAMSVHAPCGLGGIRSKSIAVA